MGPWAKSDKATSPQIPTGKAKIPSRDYTMTNQEINRKIAKVIIGVGIAVLYAASLFLLMSIVILLAELIKGSFVARIIFGLVILAIAFSFALDWATEQLEDEPTNKATK